MEISLLHYISLLVGLFLGATVAGLFLLQKQQKSQRSLNDELVILQERLHQQEGSIDQLKQTATSLEERRLALESTRNNLERNLAVKNQEISQLEQFKSEAIAGREKIITLSNYRSELDEKLKQFTETKQNLKSLELKLDTMQETNKAQTGQLAKLQEKLNHFDELSRKHSELQVQLSLSQDTASDRQAEIATLTTLLKKERDASTEKLALLNEAKEELADRFKTVAQEIFEEKGTKFNTKQEKELGNLLDPLKEQLTSFNKRINDIHESSSKDQASLRQELETLRKSNLDLNREARNLSKALKGDQKVQGNWGEMILEKVLEHSGLRKGREYETQSGYRDDDNKLFKPDVIVHLPEGRNVIIDSKVSLVAYEQSCSTEDEAIKKQALSGHVLSVRKHIKELSDKDYADLSGLKSPDFVLLFIPIESAFMSAFQADESLFQYGFERRIIVVTPSTLLATLRTIQNIWQFERQNQNTREIASRASKIYEKLRLFLVSMDDLGKQLHRAQDTYDTALKRLSQGRGNLLGQAQDLKNLGVKVKKEFPQQILELANLELEDDNQ